MTSLPVGSVTDRVALVRAIATQHLSERGALMPVLHEVMEELGHVAREDVEAIADVLNLSVAEVHGVVSFYKDFRTEPARRAHGRAVSRRGLPVGGGRGAVRRDARPRRRPGRRRRGRRGLLPRQLRARSVRDARRTPARPAVARAPRRADGGLAMSVPTKVFVPGDAAAVSVGADEVAAAFEAAGAVVVRNGSRGMLWLEPLVEVETEAGRVGFANVEPGDVAAVLAGEHGRCHRRRRRAPLAHLAAARELRPGGDRRPDVGRRLRGARRLGRAAPRPVAHSGRGGPGGHRLGPARSWRSGLPGRHQVEDRPRDRLRPEVRRLQLRRGRLRHVRRPDGRRGRPVHPGRGHDHRRPRRRRRARATSTSGPSTPTPSPPCAGPSTRPTPTATSARTSSAPATPSTSTCASAPAPTSAARSPRCSTASRASAARCAPSRRSPPSRACGGGRRPSTTC